MKLEKQLNLKFKKGHMVKFGISHVAFHKSHCTLKKY